MSEADAAAASAAGGAAGAGAAAAAGAGAGGGAAAESSSVPRPSRERKSITRFVEEGAAPASHVFIVPEGIGCALGDVEDVAEQVSALSRNSVELELVHKALYGGVRPRAADVKKHILTFKGLAIGEEDYAALKAKLSELVESDGEDDETEISIDDLPESLQKASARLYKMSAADLRHVCSVLNLPRGSGTKGDLAHGILLYIAKPTKEPASVALEVQSKKRSKSDAKAVASPGKRAKSSGNSSSNSKSAGSASKSKSKGGASARSSSPYMLFASEHRASVVRDNPGISLVDVARKLGELWRKISDEERAKYSAEYQKAKAALADGGSAAAASSSKASGGKAGKSKAKSAAASAKPAASASSSAAAASATGPSRAALAAAVSELVQSLDGREVSVKQVRESLEAKFSVSLVDRRAEIKDLVQQCIE